MSFDSSSGEKVSFKNSQNITLVASLWKADSDAVVIMAHGSGNNRYARGLFQDIALSFQSAGYNALSFDFSGHGESDDVVFNTAKSVDDVTAAITYAKEQGFKKIALFGHSFGAFSCLKAWSSKVDTMVLMGALTGPEDWQWKDRYTEEQLKKIYEDGYITTPVNDGLRKNITTDVKIFNEILAIDQKDLLNHITCPVLIIHGDDQAEKGLLSFSQKGMEFLSRDSEIVTIKGACHGFAGYTKDVSLEALKWFRRYFPKES